MQIVGDLERLFATGLYPLRIPILIAIFAVAAIVIVAAVRGRWDRAAARHRLATGALAVVLLALGVPTAWYLGSPLVLSTTLIEPPVEAADVNPGGSGAIVESASGAVDVEESANPSPHGGSPAPSSVPSGPALAAMSVRTGTFHGADDFHFGRGTATLTLRPDGSAVVRFEDFAVRNGPDLFVYLSPKASGYTDGAIELGRLKADRGSFNYRVDAGTDTSNVKSVVIWCKQFAVLFAVAPLR